MKYCDLSEIRPDTTIKANHKPNPSSSILPGILPSPDDGLLGVLGLVEGGVGEHPEGGQFD